jgi:thiol-disulfide isomerase/thioredoxin
MMKKNFLISLVVLGFLFGGCDNKTTIDESVIAKKTVVKETNNTFVSQSFNLVTVDDKTISFKTTQIGIDFDNYKGQKAILIDVFATWCPPCIEELPILKEVKEKYKDKFEIVSVLFEKDKDKKEILEFISKNQINYPITLGEENFKLAKELGNVQKIPEMFLFSKDGKFIKKFIGKTLKEELEKYIQIAIEN